jgi:hypothetical protein
MLPANDQRSIGHERKTDMSVVVYLVLTAAVFAALGLTLKLGS